MNKEDWDKFCKVFNLSVEVTVPKKVTRQDIIMTLLNEGEIAFNGGDNGIFILTINKNWDLETIKTLVWNRVKEYKEKQEVQP